jgi:SAM-dependent methyltransferase
MPRFTIDELRRQLSEPTLDALFRHRFFARRGDLLRLPVILIPYGDFSYLAEARHLVEHPQLYRTRPAHLSDQTHLQIEFALRFNREGGPLSLLDMGCGIGLAGLELRPWCRRRVGAEMSERNLMFARANAELRSDAEVAFVPSDLFANVSGRFDLIMFNPWRPTEERLLLVCRSWPNPRYLTGAGRIVLHVSSLAEAGGEKVMGQLAVMPREQGCVADRRLLRAWIDRPAGSARAVSTLSALISRRAVQGERAGSQDEDERPPLEAPAPSHPLGRGGPFPLSMPSARRWSKRTASEAMREMPGTQLAEL